MTTSIIAERTRQRARALANLDRIRARARVRFWQGMSVRLLAACAGLNKPTPTQAAVMLTMQNRLASYAARAAATAEQASAFAVEADSLAKST